MKNPHQTTSNLITHVGSYSRAVFFAPPPRLKWVNRLNHASEFFLSVFRHLLLLQKTTTKQHLGFSSGRGNRALCFCAAGKNPDNSTSSRFNHSICQTSQQRLNVFTVITPQP